jgi:hypothetical protein
MDMGRYDYDLPSLIASRVVADGAPSALKNRNSKKNKRPLFDRVSFGWQLILISPLFSSFAIWNVKAGSRSSE